METIALNACQEKLIAFNLALSYREDMSREALYDATRGFWRVSIRRAKQAEYALGVYQGVVKEVYAIHQWLPAREIFRPTLSDAEVPEGRYGFTGETAEESIRKRYIGKRLSGLNPRNAFQYSF